MLDRWRRLRFIRGPLFLDLQMVVSKSFRRSRAGVCVCVCACVCACVCVCVCVCFVCVFVFILHDTRVVTGISRFENV